MNMNFTEEQLSFANHRSKHLILDAPAGSGKTETVAERVRLLANEGKTVLLVCFTHSAERTLQKRLDDAGIDVKVRRITSLAVEIMNDTFGKGVYEIGDGQAIAEEVAVRGVAKASQILQLETLIANGAPLPRSMPSAVGEIFAKFTALKKERGYLTFTDIFLIANGLKQYPVDEIVVDEAQDLSTLHLNMLLSFGASAITLAGDPGQALFGFNGVNAELFSELVHEGWDKVSLTKTFRVPAGILPAVNATRSTPLQAVRTGGSIRTLYTDYKGAAGALERVLKPGDVVVGRTSRNLERVASRIEEKTSMPVSRSWQEGVQADTVQFSTIHAAKGGEWDRVYVLDVCERGFYSRLETSEAEQERLFYVAASRAQHELILVSIGEELPWGLE